MCFGCTRIGRIAWSFVIGAVILILALLIGILWPILLNNLLSSQLRLYNGTMNFKNWEKTPFPLYLEVYLFNWTNTEELDDWRIVKPKFQELGPFVFEELHERVNIKYNKDETEVAFNQTKTWWFRSDLSKGTLQDKVISLNPIAASVNYGVRYASLDLKPFISNVLDLSTLFKEATVGEWIFDGFQDGILDWVIEQGENIPEGIEIPTIPYEKFGWFVDRNQSSEFDGRFEMYTGKDDISKLGIIKTWKDQEKLPFYKGKCASLDGTTGELWPPQDPKGNKDATMFIPDLCRALTLKNKGSYTNNGLTGLKWVGDDEVFDNGNNYPDAKCWCTAAEPECPAVRPGVFNVSACQYGAPAFISFPHFYLGDYSYIDAVEGLSPNKEKHETFIALEPTLGIPIEVRARIQINLFMRQDPDIRMFQNSPNLFVPMLWFQQSADLPDDLGKMINLLLSVTEIPMIICYVLSAIGSLFIIAGIIFVIWGYRKRSNELILGKTDEVE